MEIIQIMLVVALTIAVPLLVGNLIHFGMGEGD